MRILMVSPVSLGSPRTGESIRVLALVKNLARLSEVTLISPSCESELRALGLAALLKGYRTIEMIRFGQALTVARSIVFSYDQARFAYRWPDKTTDLGEFEVVYAHQPRGWDVWRQMKSSGLAASPRLRVVDLQNDDHDLWVQHGRHEPRWATRLVARAYAHRAAKKLRQISAEADLICCVSDVDRDSLVGREGDQLLSRIAVVPNGVDCQWFAPPTNSLREATSAVLIGSLDTRMNQTVARALLAVWPHVRALLPEATLMIAGRNPPGWLLSANSPSVHVVASPQDIRPYLWQGGAFLAPFRAAAGTKIKILEAMAAGVPVIATNAALQGIPAIPWKHFLPIHDANGIPAAFRSLTANPRIAADLSKNGQRFAAAFDWSRIASDALFRVQRALDETGVSDLARH